MARIEHAAVAVVLLLAFVTDLRPLVPAVAVAVAAGLALRHGGRVGLAAVALLALATVAFLLGDEVVAWGATLAAAVVAGLRAATPVGGRRAVGASG